MQSATRTISQILMTILLITGVVLSPNHAQSQSTNGGVVPSDLTRAKEGQVSRAGSSQMDAARALRVSTYTRTGSQRYKKGLFNEALWHYEQAQRLAPENAQLKAVIADSVKQYANQKALLRQLQEAGRDQSEYVISTYDKAVGDFNASNTEEARLGFQRVWLLSGDYKETLAYLEKLGNATGTLAAPPQETVQERAPQVLRVAQPPVITKTPIPVTVTPIEKDDIIQEYDALIKLYEQILKINPNNPQAKVSLEGTQKMRQDELNRRAATASETAKAIAAEKAQVNAEEMAQQDKEFQMAKARAIANLILDARAAQKKGDEENALECYHKALLLDQNSSHALKGQQDILETRRQRLLAIERTSALPVKVVHIPGKMQEAEAKRRMLEAEITNALNAVRDSGDAVKYERMIEVYKSAWRFTLQASQ